MSWIAVPAPACAKACSDQSVTPVISSPIRGLAGAGSSRAEQQREQEHLQVLADYTLAIGTALNLEGKAPFEYPGIQAYDALADIDASLSELAKRGDR